MRYKVLFYVDNQITESSGKIYDSLEGAQTAVRNWNEQTEALYESVWAIVSFDTGDIVSLGKIRQSFDEREKRMGKNAK